MKLKAVLFDMGGTLLQESRVGEMGAVLREMIAMYPSLEDRIEEAHRRFLVCREEDLRNLTQRSFESVFRSVHQEFPNIWLQSEDGVERLLETIFCHCAGMARPFPEAASVLRTLRRRKVRLGLVSNVSFEGRRYDALFQRFPVVGKKTFRDVLEARVWSTDVAVRKPHPRPFAVALARLGVGAQEALYVGNEYVKDVIGARLAGMPAVLVDRTGSFPRDLGDGPEWVVKDLRGVLAITSGKRKKK